MPHLSSTAPAAGRRAFLVLAAAGVAAACASPAAEPRRVPRAAPSTTPEPVPSSTPTPAAPSVPAARTRDAVVARYAGVTPTAFGLDVPGVVNRLPTSERVVALTFDACGGARGSGYDAALIETLRATGTPATLFLNQRWISAHPDLAAELAADPLFELANHGTAHRPLSVSGAAAYGIPGTTGAGEVFDEVEGNRRTLTELTGTAPRFFRSGTAHYDDVAVRIAGELGETVVNFDVNGDGGATFGPRQVTAALQTVSAGSIVIGHLNQPTGGTAAGVAAALPRLTADSFRFVRLSEYV